MPSIAQNRWPTVDRELLVVNSYDHWRVGPKRFGHLASFGQSIMVALHAPPRDFHRLFEILGS